MNRPRLLFQLRVGGLLLLVLALSCSAAQIAVAQSPPGSPPNLDPERMRAIVQENAAKLGAKAVLFGVCATTARS
jgi:hypothetical protein